MKNIHILPTDKPSNGYILGKCIKELSDVKIGQFTKTYYLMFDEKYFQPQNIYITSDEEIKVGDWYINTFVSEREQKPQTHTEKRHLINHQKDYRFKYCKKIILTTDVDLIKDGVQAIDDEFLEWFVKNPSCEEVEVRSFIDAFELRIIYKIIIPQEEPKCTCEKPNDNTCDFCDAQESKRILEDARIIHNKQEFEFLNGFIPTSFFDKQETIEEIVETLDTKQLDKLDIFLKGVQWKDTQNKELYDDLVDLLERLTPIYREDSDLHLKYEQKKMELIETLKKK